MDKNLHYKNVYQMYLNAITKNKTFLKAIPTELGQQCLLEYKNSNLINLMSIYW